MSKPIMLIVDDQKVNRAALAVCFSQQFTIVQAENGKEAMAYLAQGGKSVAIILLDILMPEMNGIDFLKWISTSVYRDIPVVAVTSDPSYQLEALENGAWDFIAKPIEMRILKARVHNVLGRYGFLYEKKRNSTLGTVNEQLEKAQSQLKHLINSIPGGIAIYCLTDHFETRFFSDGVAALSGYTHDEYLAWIGDDASRAIFESDRTRVLSLAMQMLRRGEPIDETYRIYHKDGHLVWVRLTGMPMERTPEGIMVYAVFQSVSPQTQLYQNVLNEIQTAVYACDMDTYEILYFNRQMAALAGVEPTDATGKKCYEYLFHRDAPCSFCRMKSMQKDTLLEREFLYPANHRTYRMKGKLFSWNEITAHVEYIEDITEQKAIKAKSDTLLIQLTSMMDNVPGALCLYKFDGEKLEPMIHNHAFYQVLGYSEKNIESVNRSTNFLNVHPDDLAALRAAIGQSLAQSQSMRHTYRLYHDEKKRYIWLRLNTRVVDQSDGTKMVYCTYSDVTEEKESEQIAIAAKERSELQYRRQMQLIDSMNDTGLIAKGYCNLTRNQLMSYSGISDDIPNFKPDLSFDSALHFLASHALTAEKAEEILCTFNRQTLIQNFAQGKSELTAEYPWKLPSGTTAWISLICRMVLEPETNDILCFVYGYDITEQVMERNLVMRLTETEHDFLAVIDIETRRLSMRNIKPGVEGGISKENTNYEDNYTCAITKNVLPEEQEEVLGKSRLENLIDHLNRDGEYYFTFSVRGKNGEIYRKKLQYCYLDDTKRTILASRTDITEMYKAQQIQLEKTKAALMDAKQANSAKTDFLSRMSHDIRTPLNAVIGLAGLGASSDSVAEMQEYLGQIGASGTYLLSIINDVLDMSKIESKSLVLHPSVVYLPDFIKETTAIIMPAVMEKNIHFAVKQQGVSSSYMRFDTTYIRQVAVNLLSNAIKFTPVGGHVTLSLENISCSDKWVKNRMIIQDDGVGISKEFLPKIFSPFEQENSTNDATRQGTGLGLAIVKSIVDVMKGSIRVESEKGKGTAFIIEWDLELAAAPDVHSLNFPPPDMSISLVGRHILLCEDHPLNTQIATKLLEKKGITVIHAQNGQLATQMFEQSAPGYFDAILMDIRMPVMDGLEATRKIRGSNHVDAKTVPIIAMTANAFDEDVQSSFSAGMNAHLSKPIEPQKLYDALLGQLKKKADMQ